LKLSRLATIYEAIAEATGEPERVAILRDLFRSLDRKTLAAVAHLTAGEVVDPVLSDTLGIGPGTIRDALAGLTGRSPAEVVEAVRRSGDLSAGAADLVGGEDTLTVTELWRRVNRAVERDEDRRALIEWVYAHTTPEGARYFTRMVLGQMRIGIGLGALIRAISRAFEVEEDVLQRLYALSDDIGMVAVRASRGRASVMRAGLELFRPYQFMNAQKVDDPAEIFERLGGGPIIFEVKYDGARLQIHIRDGAPLEIRLYSRRLNDVTAALPDVVAALRRGWKGGDAIIEGEAVAYDATLQRKQPFQAVLTRLGRKYDVEETARETPFILYLFDILYHKGEELMSLPEKERRSRLRKLFRVGDRLKLTADLVTSDPAEEDAFFRAAIEEGHEGLVAKDPDAVYVPGRRTENWMKIKPAFETLDVVIVGGIWGSGRRKGTLSSLIVAVRDDERLLTVGKVGTGFSEQALRDLTAKLEPLIVGGSGRSVEVEPSIVIEVDFQGIQKTSAYDAGYALRIPRFKRERIDKSVREADTLERLLRLYTSSLREGR
jgi:DNA ligase-1